MSSPIVTTGDLISAADWNAGSLGHHGYGQTTTSVGSITTSVITLASAAYGVAPNRRMEATGTWKGLISTIIDDRVRIELADGVATRNQQIIRLDAASVEMGGGTIYASFDSGAVGSSTMVIRAIRHTGTGTITVTASSDAPISVSVKDVGPI